MNYDIKLDSSHMYSVDGKWYPGVTEILDTIYHNPFWTEEGARRGQYIHARCHEITQGLIDDAWWQWIEENHPGIIYELKGWEAFLYENNLDDRPCFIEHSMFSPSLCCCGTPDVIFPADQICIEIKTGLRVPQKLLHIYQIVAYDHILKDNLKTNPFAEYNFKGPWTWYLVYLSEKGYDEINVNEAVKDEGFDFRGLVNKFKSFQVTYLEARKFK